MKKTGLVIGSILVSILLLIGLINILISSKTKEIEIKKAEITIDQSYGASMVSLDYASDDIIIFHGYFGLFVYSIRESKIINSIDLRYIDCSYTQGDNYCDVSVSKDGKKVQLHNISSKDMYLYSVEENTLTKTMYSPIENRFEVIETPEEVRNSFNLCSPEAVKFENGDIGYLVLYNDKINTLEYIRADKKFKIFNE